MTPKSLLPLVFLAACAAPPPPPVEHADGAGMTPAEYAISAWNLSHEDDELSFKCEIQTSVVPVELVDNMAKAPCVPARAGFQVSGCIFRDESGIHLQVLRFAGWAIQVHERMHLAHYCATHIVDEHHQDAFFWSFDPSNALHE